jgi:hypothetical protein
VKKIFGCLFLFFFIFQDILGMEGKCPLIEFFRESDVLESGVSEKKMLQRMLENAKKTLFLLVFRNPKKFKKYTLECNCIAQSISNYQECLDSNCFWEIFKRIFALEKKCVQGKKIDFYLN